METRSNNQQYVFIRASEIKGIRLTNYYFCTLQDLLNGLLSLELGFGK